MGDERVAPVTLVSALSFSAKERHSLSELSSFVFFAFLDLSQVVVVAEITVV